MANELRKAAGATKWPSPPELAELEKIAGRVIAAGYFCVSDLRDTSALSSALNCVNYGRSNGLSGRVRCVSGIGVRESVELQIDVYAALNARRWLPGIGDVCRPLQGAVDLLPQALRGDSKTAPPCGGAVDLLPFAPSELEEAVRALQDPARKSCRGGAEPTTSQLGKNEFPEDGAASVAFLRYSRRGSGRAGNTER